MDEIDAIGRIRTCEEGETTRRLKSELLCQIDGINTGDEMGDEPFIFGCTNCPWDLDPAVLRRFSRRIFVDLPNSQGMVRTVTIYFEPDKRLLNRFRCDITTQKAYKKSTNKRNRLVED